MMRKASAYVPISIYGKPHTFWSPHPNQLKQERYLMDGIEAVNNTNRKTARLSNLKDYDSDGVRQLQQKQCFMEVVEEVCGIIRTRPRWESSLHLHFPPLFNFLDPKFFHEVLKRQNNAFLSFRFFNWLNSHAEFLPDNLSAKMLFDALVESKASSVAESFLRTVNFDPEPGSLENLIKCFSENGSVDEALGLFLTLKSCGHCPSISTCHAALSGSLMVGRTDVFWKLYEEMMKSGIAADIEIVGYLIEAFCIENNIGEGYELLRQVLKDGIAPNNVAFTKLIFGFCIKGNYGKVSEILHMMIARNRKPDIRTYQEVIYGICSRREGLEGYRVFNDLKSRGYFPDRVMYTTMIHGLCEIGCLGEGRKLWFEMIQKGLPPSEYTYNTLIHGFCMNGNLEEARKLYKEMCDKGYKETTVSYNTLIGGLCRNGKTKEAYHLFEEMSQKGIIRDLISYNSMITGLCEERNVIKGLEVFHEILAQGLEPSVSSYTPLIEQYGELGRMEEAIELWADMEKRGLKPSAYNHECMIAGFCQKGLSDKGVQWFTEMVRAKLKPQPQTYVRLILCLSQTNKLDDALAILHSMFHVGHMLGEHVCSALVSKLCGNNFCDVETLLSRALERG